ncbi:MAG TPA: site-2 protease family protein [Thermoanaerobaculia bacterium]|jgi:Zn-dependent protease|nr:site-2 protease family protein [Thermoanaerobaculia bacterium]
MDPSFVFSTLIQILLLWLAIAIHESAHARVASGCGDPTARELGRVSLNPIRHVDLLGSMLFPSLLLAMGWPVFGWGRSTPVLREKLRRPVVDDFLVLMAGPAANFAVAVAATIAIVVTLRELGPGAREAAVRALFSISGTLGGEKLPSFPVMFTLVRLASINALMAAFNLIPLPPLDGGQIALYLLPPDWADRLAAVRPYGFMIGVLAAVGLVPVLTILLGLVINLS